MNCVRCHVHIDWAAPFCPVCGADPHLGTPWLASSHLAVDRRGRIVQPTAGERTESGVFELVAALLYPAWRIAVAEVSLFEALGREPVEGEDGKTEWSETLRMMRAAHEAAAKSVEAALPLFRAAVAAITEARDGGRVDDEALSTRYNEVPWVLGEYGVYLEELDRQALMDILWKRVNVLGGRRGYGQAKTWEAPDGRFSITYNGGVLRALSATTDDAGRFMRALGEKGRAVFGELALVLVPAAWREWDDLAMAPSAALFVHVLDNPLAAVTADRLGWRGDRAGACEYYGQHVFGEEWDADDVRPCTVAGLPAVRSMQHYAGSPSVLSDYVWVRGETAIFTLIAVAPEQRADLCTAVFGALSRFAPEGRPPARDAVVPGRAEEPGAAKARGASEAPETPGASGERPRKEAT